MIWAYVLGVVVLACDLGVWLGWMIWADSIGG